jgi:hypothetical protein
MTKTPAKTTSTPEAKPAAKAVKRAAAKKPAAKAVATAPADSGKARVNPQGAIKTTWVVAPKA